MDNSGYIGQLVSVVIPCFNEAGNILALYSELSDKLKGCNAEYIFIDDGSTDGTLDTIKDLSAKDSQVKYISFSRNFGHQNALMAGLRNAHGAAVVTIDADLQHPASLIPRLLEKWQEGFDVVNTRRLRTKNAGLFKSITSKMFYRMMSYLTDMDFSDGFADFRLLGRKVVDAIKDTGESEVFIRGMVKWYGFRQTVIEYNAGKRFSGETKYTLRNMILFSLNGLTSFSIRPLRLSIVLSALLAMLCLAEICYALYTLLIVGTAVSGWTSTVILISVIGAMTLLMLGIVGEYVGRTFMQCKGRPLYIVRETNL